MDLRHKNTLLIHSLKRQITTKLRENLIRANSDQHSNNFRPVFDQRVYKHAFGTDADTRQRTSSTSEIHFFSSLLRTTWLSVAVVILGQPCCRTRTLMDTANKQRDSTRQSMQALLADSATICAPVVYFSSVQFKMVSVHSQKAPVRSTLSLRSLANATFDCRWSSLVIFRKIVEDVGKTGTLHDKLVTLS